MIRTAAPGNSSEGFTLVEVLVSMFILTLLIIMVTQLMNTASRTISTSRRHMDADSQARMIFARMGNDFSKIVKRPDVDYIFCKSGTTSATSGSNDAMFFYSNAPAYFSASGASTQNTVSLIGYRVHSDPDPNNPSRNVPQLERLGKGLTWDGASSGSSGAVVFLTPATGGVPLGASTIAGNWPTIGSAAATFSDGADADYHVLGDEAYRMEIAFLLTNGTTSNLPVISPNIFSRPPGPTDIGYPSGARWYDNSANSTGGRAYICTNASANASVWVPLGIKDVSAVIVAIAILDDTSREVVTNTGNMISALADSMDSDLALTPPKLMAQTWLAAVQSGNSGVSVPLASAQIRVYQNYFYLNDN